MDNADDTLIRALQDSRLFDHPVMSFTVVETHISWVLLTGERAYKIKKPVDLGFLDFSTLAKRKHYCEEELRLNRRLAPQFYLEVVPICGSAATPQLRGDGEVIEYAVMMQQFPGEAQLERVAAAGRLLPRHIDNLAETVADFHARVDVASAELRYGEPLRVLQPVLENFDYLDACCTNLDDKDALAGLQYWCTTSHTRLTPLLQQRKAEGFVRECHGDMHLANMFLWQDKVMLYDCIEFNPELRWIDVISEIAFLTMDLRDRDHVALARRFLNRYLQHTGDYAGLALLDFYQVYRAMVRAKVACIRLHQSHLNEQQRRQAQQDTLQYLQLARQFTRPTSPALLITHGLSGSGKTFLTQALLEAMDVIRVRADIERKRLFGYAALASTGSAPNQGLYTPAASEQTYARLAGLARVVIDAGYTAIVDAAFLSRSRRDAFHQLALELKVPFLILNFQASEPTLRERIMARTAAGHDASEADLQVLAQQLQTREPLGEDELPYCINIDSETEGIGARIAAGVTRALT